jgi:hypothetical protein
LIFTHAGLPPGAIGRIDALRDDSFAGVGDERRMHRMGRLLATADSNR